MSLTVQQLVNQLLDCPNMEAPVFVYDRLGEDWQAVSRVVFEGQGSETEALVRYESEDDPEDGE